ncbi:MAG: hypothetical protein Q9217_000184 [Psora testacea]
MSIARSSNSSDEEYLQERFGPLLSISSKSLLTLASNTRDRIWPPGKKGPQNCRLVSRLFGSYNLVHVVEFADGIKYVIRVPATGWGNRFTETARSSFESQALTMRFIRKETTIPLPNIYAIDSTSSNEIGAPYIVMSFIAGFTVSSKWFDKTGPTPLEERRQRTLDTVAEAISQLRRFQFDKIGSLQFNGGTSKDSITIGPCYKWDEGTIGDEDYGQKLSVEQSGPFTTSKSYLRHYLNKHKNVGHCYPLTIGSQKLVYSMIRHLPSSTNNPSARQGLETFVLSLPDYDSQNIMIDERGNLTGIIDWDNVQAVPRFLGYSSFPGWITRDWDPIMYNYPGNERENSPEELEQYRERYSSKMKQLLHEDGDSCFTTKSHVYEAVAIAATNDDCRLEIVRKLVKCVFEERDALDLIEDVGQGELGFKDQCKLETGFRALFSISGTGCKIRG